MNKPAAVQEVWVTGSASGIGLATAERLHRDGWQVQGFDRHARTDASWPEHLVDLSDTAQTTALVGRLLEQTVPAAWVHAAGHLCTAALGEMEEAQGLQMWAVHVQAAMTIANSLLPKMAQRQFGRVVLIGSRIAGGKPGRSQYAATKAALPAMARSWAAETVSQGVTINVVSPAATDTPMSLGSQRRNSPVQLPPIGRLITPAEVAATVAFLLSPDAAAITGQNLIICGGASLPT